MPRRGPRGTIGGGGRSRKPARRRPKRVRQPAFARPLGQGLPVERLQKRQRKAKRKVVRRVLAQPGAPRKPIRPRLKHPTKRQTRAISKARGKYQGRAIRYAGRQGVKGGAVLDETARRLRTPDRTVRRYERLAAELRTSRRLAYARSVGSRSTREYARANRARPYRDSDIKAAGVNLSNAGSSLESSLFPKGTNLRVVTAPYHIARATVEDPGGVAGGTVKGVRDMVVGFPSAAVRSVSDPKGALRDLSKDFTRRYGPLAKGDARKFRERIKKEGAASEILDATAIGAVEGRVLGVGLKASGRPVMTKPRPKLRTSGGRTRDQDVSPNAFKAVGQRGLDEARRRKTARLQKRERAPALDRSLRPGEVAPIRRKQVLGNREVARRKSRGVAAMKGEQSREVHRGASRAVAKMSRPERRAFKYAMELGIRTPEAAGAALTKHRAYIVGNREAEGVEIPKALARTNDELPVIDRLLEAPEKAFTPRLAKVADGERARIARVAAGDPGLVKKQVILREMSPQAEHLGVKRRGVDELKAAEAEVPKVRQRVLKGKATPADLAKAEKAVGVAKRRVEPVLKFRQRVRVEAAKQGLTEPAYFKSSKRPASRFAEYALGGSKATADDKAYTGALFRTGREDVSPQVHSDALAAGIKRKHNWNTVADNFDEHAFGWGKNKPLSQLLDELDKRGIDAGDVAFWNPRKYRESRKSMGEVDENPFGDDIAPPGLDKAVDDAATDVKGLATKGEGFRNTSGWSVIPKSVYDEIHADTRPSSGAARAWDVTKTKQSRILLGTNPPWLAFQVGSNALLTGLAKTGPIDAVKAQVWWRRLDEKQRAAVEPYVGLGPFHVDVAQPKLGAATNNRLVNAYRAFKDTPIMRRAGKVNPLDAMFRADNAQNNFFRRSVLYSQAKRDAYQRIGQNAGRAAETEARLQGLFTLGPEKQIRAVLRNQDALERHAQYVNDMLGDYATYTAKERRILGRSVMFYGFLRFSLNFAFHTMPTRHPIMTALIGNLGRLQTEEVREILGGDELPFALGRIYIKKDGKLQVVDLTRLNPASNVLVDTVSASDLGKPIGMLPPIVSAAFDLAYGKSSFKGKALRVKGETGGGAFEREATGERIGGVDAGRVALERLLSLAFPYRAAKKVAAKGEPQGDDSLLFDLRPTKYKRPDIVKSIAKKKRETDTGQLIREQAFPFLPKPSSDPEFAKSIRERRKKGKGKPKRKGGGNPFGGGSGGGGGGNPF